MDARGDVIGRMWVTTLTQLSENRRVDTLDARIQRERSDAEQRARQWLADGNAAQSDGNKAWAEECFSKAEHWQAKAREFDKYGVR